MGGNLGDRLIADRYRLLRPLGEGHASTVYLAADETRSRDVALKLISPRGVPVKKADSFRHEFALLSTLSHPNLARAYDFGRSAEGFYYTAEVCAGEPLGAWLGKRRSSDEAVRIAAEVLTGLDHLHRQGVSHGDLRSENILCGEGGVKLIDFGLSRGGSPTDDLRRFGRTFEKAVGPLLSTDRRLGELIDRLKTDAPGRRFPDAMTALAFLHVTPAAAPVFVGRENELKRLSLARAAFVHGEEGCGKSALVDRVRVAAQLDGALVGIVRPGQAPLTAFRAVFEEITAAAGVDSRAMSRAHPGATELRMAVTQSVMDAGRKHPIVLIFEDVHELDADTFSLAQHFAEVLPLADGVRARVALTWRDAEFAGQQRAADLARVRAEDIHLGPLDVAAVTQARLGGVASAELVAELQKATEGNGVLLDALLRQPGAFAQRDGAWHATQPLSVRVAGSYHELTEDGRELAALFAASPCPIAKRTLQRFYYQARLDRALIEVIRGGWLRTAGPDRWVIASAVRRRAVPVDEVAKRHRELGLALESFGGKPDVERLGALTTHFLAAGDMDRARRFGLRYASACRRKHAYAAAADTYEKCAEGAASAQALDLLERARASWYAAGRLERTVAAARRQVAVERSAQTLMRLGQALQAKGEMPEAIETFRTASEVAEGDVRAEALCEVAHTYGMGRRMKEFKEALQNAQEASQDSVSPRVRTLLAMAMVKEACLGSDFERAAAMTLEATRGATATADPRLVFRATAGAGYLCTAANAHYRSAERYVSTALRMARQGGLTLDATICRVHLASMDRVRGKPLKARAGLEPAVSALLRAGSWMSLNNAAHNLALVLLDLGHAWDAIKAARLSRAAAERVGDTYVRARTWALEALGAALLQDYRAYATAMNECRLLLPEVQERFTPDVAARTELIARWEAGLATADELRASHDRWLKQLHAPVDAALIDVLAAVQGYGTIEETTETLDALRAWPNRIAEARVRCALAYIHEREGRRSQAVSELNRSTKLVGRFEGLEGLDILRWMLIARTSDHLPARASAFATKAYHEAHRRRRLRLAEEAAELTAEIAHKTGNAQRAEHWYREAMRVCDERLATATEDLSMRDPIEKRRQSLEQKLGGLNGSGPETGWMKRILDLDRALMSSLELPKLLRRIIDALIEITGAERGFIVLAEGGEFRPAVSRNLDKMDLRSADFRVSRTIAERVMSYRKAFVCADAQEDDELRDASSVREGRLHSILCMPLVTGETVVGVVYLDNRHRSGVFEAIDQSLVEAFVDRAALAIHNARLLQAARRERKDSKALAAIATEAAPATARPEPARPGRDAKPRHHAFDLLVGNSQALVSVVDTLERAAATDLPLLILGETGTGKELAARGVHAASKRANKPFVPLNCAALPGSVLESELFGHVRGAFTGAERDKAGLFETASGGILFLDEIGEMPAALQAKLLRALQHGEIRRVGANQSIQVDVRIVAASNRDLARMVKEGTFREDLYYRLKRIVVTMPPLRQRKEDIPVLLQHFLGRAQKTHGPRELAPSAAATLIDYGWPGNVRELEGVIDACAVLTDRMITADHIAGQLRMPSNVESDSLDLKASVERTERALVTKALETSKNIRHAAKTLGIARAQLYRLMERYKLHPKQR